MKKYKKGYKGGNCPLSSSTSISTLRNENYLIII